MMLQLLESDGLAIRPEAFPGLTSIAEKQRFYSESRPYIRKYGRQAVASLIDNATENSLLDQLHEIDATKFGVNVPKQETDTGGAELVDITGQTFIRHGQVLTVPERYTTPAVLRAFVEMSRAAERALDHPLVMQTGYRSSAYNALLFARVLVDNNYDINSTVQLVALPGYGEHSNIQSLASDFMLFDTTNQPNIFGNSPEYDWLLNNAPSYDFTLSYPPENPQGMDFEPWHWRHDIK